MSLCCLPSQSFGGGRGRKGEEVGQFLQIEDHAAPTTLAEENILFVVTRRIFVVKEWEEMIAAGTGQGREARGHVRDDLPASPDLFRTRRKTNDDRKKRRGRFLLGTTNKLRPVHKERPAFIIRDSDNGALG